MPTFDFNLVQTNDAEGTGALTLTQTYSAGSDTVLFTLSSTDADDKKMQFGFSTSSFGIGLRDKIDNDVFTLKFQNTATPSLIGITGNATNPITVGNGGFVLGAFRVDFQTAGGGIVAGGTINGAGQAVTGPNGTTITGIRFTSLTSASADSMEIDNLSYNAMTTCFCAGTRIKTPTGWILVEDLVAGDQISTPGGTTTVQWLGKQTINSRLTTPEKVNPIRIAADAIAQGVPSRDLYVSPDHAIALDGMLINAAVLVNGTTISIVRDMPLDGFVYYHVETEQHEVILAEDCPAESYLDALSRDTFDNGAERAFAPAIKEMNLPRIASKRLVPSAIRAKLEARADSHFKLAS